MFLRIRLLISTLWVGSGWTIGYLVAPTLFLSLADPMQAGDIAGKLFRVQAWLTVVCAIALLALLTAARRDFEHGRGSAQNRAQIRAQMLLVSAMLGCTVVAYFGLQPFMALLRETAVMNGGVRGPMTGAVKVQFGILHGVASLLYLLQSVLGGALVLRTK